MNDITFIILKLVVSVSFALITAYLIPLIKNKIASDKYKDLVDTIKVGVSAAEQVFKESGMGRVKKEDVIIFVNGWMSEHGITISEKQLSQLIEAAVFEMNKDKKKEND